VLGGVRGGREYARVLVALVCVRVSRTAAFAVMMFMCVGSPPCGSESVGCFVHPAGSRRFVCGSMRALTEVTVVGVVTCVRVSGCGVRRERRGLCAACGVWRAVSVVAWCPMYRWCFWVECGVGQLSC